MPRKNENSRKFENQVYISKNKKLIRSSRIKIKEIKKLENHDINFIDIYDFLICCH